MTNKVAQNDFPIAECIYKRWSPRAFSDESVSNIFLQSIFEAGRWAMSSYNEQPWRFFVAKKEDVHYPEMFSCLNEWNQKWAKTAPVIVLICGKKTFTYDGSENRSYMYDCGAAAAFMTIEATELGLYCHQMAGILRDRAREILTIPDDFDVLTAMAIGYVGDMQKIDTEFHKDEQAIRTRKPLKNLVFGSSWGSSYPATKKPITLK